MWTSTARRAHRSSPRQQALHHGRNAARRVLRFIVDVEGMLARRVMPSGEFERHALGGQERLVLLDQPGLGRSRIRDDGDCKLGQIGKASLQFKVGRWALRWNAPLAMKRMWSVRTTPYLVLPQCLPPAAAGRAAPLARHVGARSVGARGTLSILSMKTMPFCSAF
jgi:hypothetical protein